MSYAVVNTDNYGSDYPNEKFLVERVRTKFNAEAIAHFMNQEFCRDDHDTRYWKVVEEPYQLQPGFEP